MNALNSKVVTFIFCALILVGCSKPPVPQVQNEEEIQLAPTQQALSNESTEEYYRTIIPYISSPTRGLVYSYLSSRYDIDEFELSLMRQSQSYFDSSKVYFQEGQYLDKPTVKSMLARKKTEAKLNEQLAVDPDYVDLGLNPSEDTMIEVNGVTLNPVYLAYLLEQDYVVLERRSTKVTRSLNRISSKSLSNF